MHFTNPELAQFNDFKESAVLVFVLKNDEILLIHKKRGLGAGLINGPGGKLEKGETFLAAAARETKEEVGIEVQELSYCANLGFFFDDGFSLYGRVFITRKFEGLLTETDEALPFWSPIDSIPYDKMWADDILWLPKVLSGEFIDAAFWFSGDKITQQKIYSKKNSADHAELLS